MKVIGVQHVQITIPRGAEAQARAWAYYCGLLGLPEIERPSSLQGNGGFWVQAGLIQIHVGIEDSVERERHRTHVAYEVENIGDARARIADAGYTTEELVPIPGFARFESRDPFGNRVEFIQHLAGHGR